MNQALNTGRRATSTHLTFGSDFGGPVATEEPEKNTLVVRTLGPYLLQGHQTSRRS
jgi:hypothetical protein